MVPMHANDDNNHIKNIVTVSNGKKEEEGEKK
jgi:hypothetical protein